MSQASCFGDRGELINVWCPLVPSDLIISRSLGHKTLLWLGEGKGRGSEGGQDLAGVEWMKRQREWGVGRGGRREGGVEIFIEC